MTLWFCAWCCTTSIIETSLTILPQRVNPLQQIASSGVRFEDGGCENSYVECNKLKACTVLANTGVTGQSRPSTEIWSRDFTVLVLQDADKSLSRVLQHQPFVSIFNRMTPWHISGTTVKFQR